MSPLVLIPGLGADARLFAPQREAFPDLFVPDWQQPKPRESLAAYAARWAATLPITPDTILAGVSFGGMLSLEIAKITRPRAVILIATCRHPRAIAASVQRFAKVALSLPLPAAASRLAPLALPVLGPMGDAERRAVLAMAESASLPFMRWGGRAILNWDGCESAPCPVFHIHGRRDRVIPAAGVKADLFIPGAGHIVNLTHAKQVNDAIAEYIERLGPTPASPASPASP